MSRKKKKTMSRSARNAKMTVSRCQLLAALDEFEPPVQTKWYRAEDETIPETWKESTCNWKITLNHRSHG